MKSLRGFVAIALVAVACGIGGWVAAIETGHGKKPAVARIHVADGPATRETDVSLARQTGVTSYAGVVKIVAPGVVNVFSTRTVHGAKSESRPFQNDPLLRRFFGSGKAPPKAQTELSLGSGVIATADGYILTNYHVVDGAEEIEVSLPGPHGKEFIAQVVGRDAVTDLAVLKIQAQGLPVLSFGDSSQLKVGDVVLALGNPFAVGQTVTMGIVSGLKREGLGIEGYEDFIQTDAAINPGNSGGALVDTSGHVVGINTAILSRSGGNQGIGFAIPSNLARRIMEQLIKEGKIVRGYLGVSVQDLTPDLAHALKVPAPDTGAVVVQVVPKSPAATSGIEPGDVIVSIDRHPVDGSSSLRSQIAQSAPGHQSRVQIVRSGKKQTLTAKLKEMPR